MGVLLKERVLGQVLTICSQSLSLSPVRIRWVAARTPIPPSVLVLISINSLKNTSGMEDNVEISCQSVGLGDNLDKFRGESCLHFSFVALYQNHVGVWSQRITTFQTRLSGMAGIPSIKMQEPETQLFFKYNWRQHPKLISLSPRRQKFVTPYHKNTKTVNSTPKFCVNMSRRLSNREYSHNTKKINDHTIHQTRVWFQR